MEGTKNIILKQTVQFNYNGRTDGIALQQEVHDWCTNILLPEIDQQLDLLVPRSEYLVIDKLEIDALINKKDWKQELRYILLHQFAEKIREQKFAHVQTNQSSNAVQRRTDDLVLFYLDKGYLPWWSVTIVKENFAETFNEWLNEDKQEGRAKRIVEQLTKMDFAKLQQRLLAAVPTDLFFQFAAGLFNNHKETLARTDYFFKYTLANVAKAKQQIIVQKLSSFIFISLLENNMIDEDELLHVFFAEIQKQGLVRKITAQPADSNKMEQPVLLARWQKIVIATEKLKPTKLKEAKKSGDKSITKNDDRNLNKVKMNTTTDEAGIFINNAGLVILGPYIPLLFTKLSLSKDGELLNPDLAVCLLQYMVTSQEHFAEHELVLPKLLCGMDLEELTDTNQKITAEHKKEIDEMLQAVVGHWEAIKSTSVQGFRESFLLRSGKLVFAEDEMRLKVERKAYDILLDRIPWNISMIKLPWMPELLRTEWN